MEVIERTVVLPENQSFIIRQIDLRNNKGIIHSHSNKYELNYIVDGFGRRFVAGNIANFTPGDLLFMAPGIPHCWEIDNKEANPTAITIHFKEDFLEKALSTIPELGFLKNLLKKSESGLHLKGADNTKVLRLLRDLMTIESSYRSLVQVLDILKFIANIEHEETLKIAEFKWDTDLPQNHRLKKIYEYVFFNFKENIRLNEAASIIGITEGAFCVFFKKNTKKTFSNFIKEVRIGYACKLLSEDNDMTISQICFDSGYNNFANFNRQFKEIAKVSPKEYRQNILT
jgi:AraC-like DNA-binding protein/quercetin dioxygenase-like cupin family protein